MTANPAKRKYRTCGRWLSGHENGRGLTLELYEIFLRKYLILM